MNLESGISTVRKAAMGLPYYRAAALTDIAGYLLLQQQTTRALELLDEAEAIGLSLDDGYFVAGTLRHAGEAAMVGGLYGRARDAYDKAVAGADKMPLGQARAGALSRVATAMAESGFAMGARNVLIRAVDVADAEPDPEMRHYA